MLDISQAQLTVVATCLKTLARPRLCHRCSVALQHSFTYAPLISDVLGLSLNRVTVPAPPPQPGSPPDQPKSYEVGHCQLQCRV